MAHKQRAIVEAHGPPAALERPLRTHLLYVRSLVPCLGLSPFLALALALAFAFATSSLGNTGKPSAVDFNYHTAAAQATPAV